MYSLYFMFVDPPGHQGGHQGVHEDKLPSRGSSWYKWSSNALENRPIYSFLPFPFPSSPKIKTGPPKNQLFTNYTDSNLSR